MNTEFTEAEVNEMFTDFGFKPHPENYKTEFMKKKYANCTKLLTPDFEIQAISKMKPQHIDFTFSVVGFIEKLNLFTKSFLKAKISDESGSINIVCFSKQLFTKIENNKSYYFTLELSSFQNSNSYILKAIQPLGVITAENFKNYLSTNSFEKT